MLQKTEGAIKNGQSRDETQATLGKRYKTKNTTRKTKM